MKLRIALRFFFIFVAAVVEKGHAIGIEELEIQHPKPLEPWFTGTLLCPSGYVVPKGYMNIEPYVFFTDTFGHYNGHWKPKSMPRFWSVNPYFPMWIGLTEKLDLQTSPQFYWNETQGHSATRFGDWPVTLNIQLIEEKEKKWWPAMKLVLREVFPTGKYQKLNPKKLGTDATGYGAFTTSVGLAFSKLFHFQKAHYLNTRCFINYSIPSRVHVKGFNTYGGGFGTNGYVYPGYFITAIAGAEYSLTQNWVLAIDIFNIYTNKTRFKGVKGTGGSAGNPLEGFQTGTTSGTAIIGAPSSDTLSLAPAIEYNFSEWTGIIGGCWFSIAGRNTGQFVGGVLAVNFYFQISKTKNEPFPMYHTHEATKTVPP